MRPPLSFLFPGLNKPRNLRLSSYILSSRPFTIFVALFWTFPNKILCLSNIVVPRKGTQLVEVRLHQCRVEWDTQEKRKGLDSVQGPFGDQGLGKLQGRKNLVQGKWEGSDTCVHLHIGIKAAFPSCASHGVHLEHHRLHCPGSQGAEDFCLLVKV